MSDLEILKQDNPDLVQLLERWRSKYERSFDLKDPAEQATFYEGVLEIARHMAVTAETGTAKLTVSNVGVAGLTLSVS